MRPTWAEIDLAAVAHNVGVFKGIVGESDLCAVVKAGAYGHGAVEVGRVAVEAGATWLGVALVDEAAELRSCGIDVPVLVLSEPRPSEMAGLAELAGVRPTVYSGAGIDAFASVAPTGSPVHLKLDTGDEPGGCRSVCCSPVGEADQGEPASPWRGSSPTSPRPTSQAMSSPVTRLQRLTRPWRTSLLPVLTRRSSTWPTQGPP